MKLLVTYDWGDGEPTHAPKFNYNGNAYYKVPNNTLRVASVGQCMSPTLVPYLDAISLENS